MSRTFPAASYRRLVEDWLQRTEGPAFGQVSRMGAVRVRPDGSTAAAIGTVLTDISRPAHSVVCLVDVPSGAMRTLHLEPQCLGWAGDRLLIGSGDSVLVCDEDGHPVHRITTPGRVEHLTGSPSGGRLLAVTSPSQDEHYDVAPAGGDGGDGPLAYTDDPQRPRELVLVEAASGQSRTLDLRGRDVWEAEWIDEDRIVAIMSDRAGEGAWYAAYLAVVDTRDGSVDVRYDPVDGRQLSHPVGLGRHLLVIESISSDRGVVAGDVVCVDDAGSSTRLDTDGVDVSCLMRAGDRVGYVGLRGLTTVVGGIDVSAATCTRLWAGPETLSGFTPMGDIDVDGRVHGVMESFTRYPRLVRIEPGRVRTTHDLRHPGADAYLAAGQTAMEVSWRAPDGLEIQGIVVLPAGPGPFPLLLNVHGGPVAAWRNRWGIANGNRHPYVGLLAEQGYASLYVNPRGSHGRGQDFIDRVRGDMLGKDVDDLLSGIDHLIGQGLVDGSRVAVTGNSYGGLMSAWLAATTDRFAAAIATSPVTDFVSQHYTSDIPEFDELFLRDDITAPGNAYHARSPLTHVAGARTPTMLTAGLLDKTTPADQAVMFHQALRRQGVPTSLVLYPRQGHGIAGFPDTADFLPRMLAWLGRHLKNEAE